MSDNNPKSKPLLEDELAEEDRRERERGLPYGEIYDTAEAEKLLRDFAERCERAKYPN